MVEVKRKPVIVLVVALTAAAIIGVLNGGLSPVGAPATAAPLAADTATVPTTRIVEITLTGEGVTSADITMRVGNDTSQESVDVPMADELTGEPGMTFAVPAGTFVYFSAQIENDYGALDCELTVNDVQVSVSHADVAYGIVTCSGRV